MQVKALLLKKIILCLPFSFDIIKVEIVFFANSVQIQKRKGLFKMGWTCYGLNVPTFSRHVQD